MATADISQNGRRKTMLIYRQEDGLALLQTDTKGNQKREIPLTAADLDKLVGIWPTFRESLSNAGAQIAAPETGSQPGSRASRAPDS
jgi:hypothetical protein